MEANLGNELPGQIVGLGRCLASRTQQIAALPQCRALGLCYPSCKKQVLEQGRISPKLGNSVTSSAGESLSWHSITKGSGLGNEFFTRALS